MVTFFVTSKCEKERISHSDNTRYPITFHKNKRKAKHVCFIQKRVIKCWNKKESLNTGILRLSKDQNTKVSCFHHTEQRYFSISILANILPFFF